LLDREEAALARRQDFFRRRVEELTLYVYDAPSSVRKQRTRKPVSWPGPQPKQWWKASVGLGAWTISSSGAKYDANAAGIVDGAMRRSLSAGVSISGH
jgi:hypothetical protein